MGITHAKVSTRPQSPDPDEISRDEWNAEHVIVGDFGGGIDFDQANVGDTLSVETTGFGLTSRFLLNTDPDAPDDPFDGVTGAAISLSDGWDADDIRMEGFGGNGILLRAYEDGGVRLINVGDNFAQLSLQSDGQIRADGQSVALVSQLYGVGIAAQGGGDFAGFGVIAGNDTEFPRFVMAYGDTVHNPRISDRTLFALEDDFHDLGAYLVTRDSNAIKVEVDATATLVLNDTGAGYDATLVGAGGNGIRIQSDDRAEIVSAEVYIAAAGETENVNLGSAGLELAGFASHALLDTEGTWINYTASEKLGFYGATPVVQPTVTGSRGGNAALASLLSALATLGLIVDSTS